MRGLHHIAAGLALAAVLTPVSLNAQIRIGGIGPAGDIFGAVKSVKAISDALHSIKEPEEIKLGGNLAGMILGASPLIQDQEKQRYINRLGKWLALHSERPNLPWQFGIIDSNDYNAFSMPGGYVLVTRGLIDQMRNEAELANVLSHEIAHVVRKHHVSAIAKAARGKALGEIQKYANPGGNGIAGQFAGAFVALGRDMYVRGLDKSDEFEADRMAVVIAARSGYSPYGLAGVLQTLSGAPVDNHFSLHRRSHPEPLERIIRLDAAMGTQLDGLAGLADNFPSFTQLYVSPLPARIPVQLPPITTVAPVSPAQLGQKDPIKAKPSPETPTVVTPSAKPAVEKPTEEKPAEKKRRRWRRPDMF